MQDFLSACPWFGRATQPFITLMPSVDQGERVLGLLQLALHLKAPKPWPILGDPPGYVLWVRWHVPKRKEKKKIKALLFYPRTVNPLKVFI